MTSVTDEETRGDGENEYDFYELDTSDLLYLNRLHRLYGRDRVLGWVKGKVALPTRLQVKKYDGEDVDEEQYYEAAVDHYLGLNDGGECDA